MLVAPSALVMQRIGIDRCGPVMTVVVPWAILRISPKPARAQRRVRRVVTEPVTIPELCSVVDWPGEVDPRSRRNHRGCWDWPANHDPRHRGENARGVGTASRGGGLQHAGYHWPS